MSYTKSFDRALMFASEIHREQRRKGSGVPYITHLLAVAAIVGENDGTETEVIAALLHDAIEDTPETQESLAVRFGNGVAGIVAACSDADVTPGEEKPPWRERKEAYITRVGTAPASARLVSSADKLHNARSILADCRVVGEEVWSRFKGGRDGTLWYYRILVGTFRRADGGRDRRTSPVIEELDLVVGALHDLAREPYLPR